MESERDDAKKGGAWAVVGKASTVVGVIWVLIQIVGRLMAPSEQLGASAVIYPLKFPTTMRARAADVVNAINEEQLADALPATMRDAEARRSTAEVIVTYLHKHIPDELFQPYGKRSLFAFRYRWEFTLKNTGDREVKDLGLETPFGGLYDIIRSDGSTASGPFDGGIQIGSIRPQSSVTLDLWTDEFSGKFTRDAVILTHPDGAIRIIYAEEVTGVLAMIVGSPITPVVIIMVISALTIVAVSALPAVVKNVVARRSTAARKTVPRPEASPAHETISVSSQQDPGED
jgi:hypothetical protein